MPEFIEFPKIARLSRDVTVTEKIDGTNAAVQIVETDDFSGPGATARAGGFTLYAQSRSQFITPDKDNHGFARWVREHAEELVKLGPGVHFGEWWGSGIQRGYGLMKGEKRWSLFNVHRWSDEAARPVCCDVVPQLGRGDFDTSYIRSLMDELAALGSIAAPGFMKPEGVVVFHAQGNILLKKTFVGDDAGKAHGA